MDAQFSTSAPGPRRSGARRLQRAGKAPAVIVQNIDNLPPAGIPDAAVVEPHGNSTCATSSAAPGAARLGARTVHPRRPAGL
jgi:NAD-dependent SIR2 family protein deacetylase